MPSKLPRVSASPNYLIDGNHEGDRGTWQSDAHLFTRRPTLDSGTELQGDKHPRSGLRP